MTEPRPCNPELLPVLETVDVAPPGFLVILGKAETFLSPGIGLCVSLGCSQTHSFKPSREKKKTPAMSLAAVATTPPFVSILGTQELQRLKAASCTCKLLHVSLTLWRGSAHCDALLSNPREAHDVRFVLKRSLRKIGPDTYK